MVMNYVEQLLDISGTPSLIYPHPATCILHLHPDTSPLSLSLCLSPIALSHDA